MQLLLLRDQRKTLLRPAFRVGYNAQMPEFIGFADFAKVSEIEPPLPTIEELPVSVTPLFLP